MSVTSTPFAIPDQQAADIIIGRPLGKATRDRLRAAGEWPPCFYVGSRAFVLLKDVEDFIARRKDAAPQVRAKLQQRSHTANARRWPTHRAGGQQ